MIKALIFDVDGTLAETEELHRRAFNETFAAFGLDWRWDRERYHALLKTTGGKERMRAFVAEGCLELINTYAGLIPQLHAAKTQRYGALLAAGEIALRPGVARLIAEAERAGLKLAIATTTSKPNVEALLDATLGPGSIARFDVVAAGDSVARKKPAPDIYELALEGLGCVAEDCIAIEDSEAGLQAALGAGIATVVTVSGYTEGQDFSGASLVLDHLGEPDQPCRCLSNCKEADFAYLDLAALTALHSQYNSLEKPAPRCEPKPSPGRRSKETSDQSVEAAVTV